MSPPEYLALQKFILDSRVEQYRDAESVRDLLDGIHDKHDVVTTMYELIFANATDMPNIQEFEGVDECAQLLTDNFINDKNDSIKIKILEDLKQETLEKMGRFAPEEQAAAQAPQDNGGQQEGGAGRAAPPALRGARRGRRRGRPDAHPLKGAAHSSASRAPARGSSRRPIHCAAMPHSMTVPPDRMHSSISRL